MGKRKRKIEEAATEFKRESFPINLITVNEAMQIRFGMDDRTIREYKRAYRNEHEMPPVTLARLNEGFLLVDGFHRIRALCQLGKKEVEAIIIPVESEAEARWLALEKNLKHGLPLKTREKRQALHLYIKARKHRDAYGHAKSSRQIAREIGCLSHQSVINTIKANYPALAREMGIGEGAEDIEQTFKGHEGMTMAETAVKHVEEVLSINKCLNQGEEREWLIKLLEEAINRLRNGYDESFSSVSLSCAVPFPREDDPYAGDF